MKSKVLMIGAAMGLAIVLGSPAAAIDYTFVGDGTSWTDSSAWNPAGVPSTGDTAEISLHAVADSRFTGMPASITVKSGGFVQVLTDLWVTVDGTNQDITMDVESGGVIRPGSGHYDYDLNLADGAELHTLENAIYGNEGMTFTLNGMVRFLGLTGANAESRYDIKCEGTGGLSWELEDPVNDTGILKLRRDNVAGHFTYTGETIVKSGECQFVDNTDEDGDGTKGAPFGTLKVTVYADAKLRAYNLNLNPASTLILQGTGANSAQLLMNNGQENTVKFAMFGGTPVPAGDYTFGTHYTNYLVPRSSDPGAVLHVLQTIPEPASLTVLALGAFMLVRRRK
jgi:hypothetical protein